MSASRKLLRGFKRSWLLSICLFMALIGALCMMLSKHLLEVQITERLSKASKDKESLVFTYVSNYDKKKTLLLDDEEYHYYFLGIDEAYIHYGSTYTTFQDAILKDYITIESMLDECVKKGSKDNVNYYVHSSTKENENYKIAIETRRDEEDNVLGYYITLYPYEFDLDAYEELYNLELPQKRC